MKKLFKSAFTVLLSVVMIFTVIPFSSYAGDEAVNDGSSVSIDAANSVGKMLTQALDESAIDPDAPYYISDVSISSNTASVTYQSETDSTIVVALYDENTNQMLASAMADTMCEATSVDVEFNSAVPAHFIAKAFMLDENNAPLCKSYSTRQYTTEFEEFYAKDTEDFDNDKIINLDESKETNFAVLPADSITVEADSKTNVLLSSDIDNNEYVFGNIDSQIKSLESGDLFYLDNGDLENIVVIKVKTITVSGTTAMVIAEDIALEDAFDYIKIESECNAGDFGYDETNADENVEYEGDVDYETGEAQITTASTNLSDKISTSKKFKITEHEYKSKDEHTKAKFSGSVILKCDIEYKVYLSSEFKEISLILTPSAKMEFKATGSIEAPVRLGTLPCFSAFGITIQLEPTLKVEISGAATVNAEIKFKLGAAYNSRDDGAVSKCEKPTLTAEFKGEITVFVGLDLKPSLVAVTEHLAEVSLSGEVGVEAKATYKKNNEYEMHDCANCIDGDINGKVEIGFTATFGKDTPIEQEFDWTIFKLNSKIADFYYSITYNEFGWGCCPHIYHEFTVKVTDIAKNPLKAAVTTSQGGKIYTTTSTDSNGVAKVKSYMGSTVIEVDAADFGKVSRNVNVTSDTVNYNIILKKSGASTSDGTGSNDSVFTGFETTGTIINFGSYPQSKVTDTSLIKKLDNQTKQWESYEYYTGTGSWHDGKMEPSDYMQYADFKYGGNKYRAVTFSQYRPYYTGYTSSASHTFQDDNGYYTGNVYYFKYEPLQWRVLDASEGLVMCNSAIDSQAYNNYILDSGSLYYGDSSMSYYASDYGNSSIRDWLNEDFYNTAFSDGQQSRIKKNQTIDAKSTYSSSYDGTTTNDNKVFLLSYWDVINSNYGFSSSYSTYDTARQLKSTDYAQCQGCYKYTTSTRYYGNSWWRLRSPYNSIYAAHVHYGGYANDGHSVNNTYFGIVPALKLEKSIIQKSPARSLKFAAATKSAEKVDGINITYSACEAGGEYILLNVLGYGEDFALINENLLYIDQLTADENGNVSSTFIPKYNDESSTILLIGDFGNGVEAKVLKEEPTADLGDINADGNINSSDALLTLQHSVGQITLTDDKFTRGDVTRDNIINSSDALKILQYAVGQIDSF